MILLLVFIIVPLAEIATFIAVGERLGLPTTLITVLLTAIIGTWLLRAQGFSVLNRVQAALARGELPIAEVFQGACLLFAGALLLTPGFLTDALGFAMFVPPIRDFLGRLSLSWFMRSGKAHVHVEGHRTRSRTQSDGTRRTPPDPEILEAEFEEIEEDVPLAKPNGKGPPVSDASGRTRRP